MVIKLTARQKIAPMLRASWQQSENKTTCMSANEYVYVYVCLYAHYLIFSIRSDQYSILVYIIIYIYIHICLIICLIIMLYVEGKLEINFQIIWIDAKAGKN